MINNLKVSFYVLCGLPCHATAYPPPPPPPPPGLKSRIRSTRSKRSQSHRFVFSSVDVPGRNFPGSQDLEIRAYEDQLAKYEQNAKVRQQRSGMSSASPLPHID